MPQRPGRRKVTGYIPTKLYWEVVGRAQQVGWSLDQVLEEALRYWVVLSTDNGRMLPPKPEEPRELLCPQCGHPVVTVSTPYLRAGFCIFCLQQTIPEEEVAHLSQLSHHEPR